MNVPTLRNVYSKCAFRILPFYTDRPLSIATAFLYAHDRHSYLITNWHVVTGRDPRDQSILHESHHLSACPTGLMLRMVENASEAEGGPMVASVQGHLIELFNEGRPVWYEHPEYGHNCDVVAIELKAAILNKSIHLAVNRISEDRIPLMPGETVFILGYPIGIGTTGGLPIWKSGYVASEPEIPIKMPLKTTAAESTINTQQMPAFYVDSATRQGMSGGPIIAKHTGIWDPSDPYGNTDFGDDHVFGTSAEFLGCYSGRVHSPELEAGLGICWRKDVIEDICSARVHAPNPHIQ